MGALTLSSGQLARLPWKYSTEPWRLVTQVAVTAGLAIDVACSTLMAAWLSESLTSESDSCASRWRAPTVASWRARCSKA